MKDVTVSISDSRSGHGVWDEQLLQTSYAEVRRLARGYMRHERRNHTLQPTALVHEAYMALVRHGAVQPQSRTEFFRAMALQMRHQLIDHARRNRAQKRGGGARFIDASDTDLNVPVGENDVDAERIFQQLDQALSALRAEHPRVADVVERRVFAGSSVEEVSETLGVSPGTIKRDFAFAKSWLAERLEESPA